MPKIAVMTDVALDPYNANGHDGIVRGGIIVNDETVEALVKMAIAQAEAGADILGPSDILMDVLSYAWRFGGWRTYQCRYPVLRYKYASAYYGPFRDAVAHLAP